MTTNKPTFFDISREHLVCSRVDTICIGGVAMVVQGRPELCAVLSIRH